MPSDSNFQVCPFTVIIDTREQAPFSFRDITALKRDGGKTLIIPIEKKALNSGDYSILGHESEIAIERKEMSDFFNCCGNDRDRFEKQLDRLNRLSYGAMVIESDWLMIMRGMRDSKLNPETIRSSVIAWQMDYFSNVHWWFCGSRRNAEVTTFRILNRYWTTINSDSRII